MAVTGRFLNSTMPFRGPPLKGSFDKSIHTNPPPTEQDFKQEVKVGKEPSVAPYSALARVITHGTAEQVGTQSFSSPKHTCQFIAQAQCESPESQEFSPTCTSPPHSYRQYSRPSPLQSSHLSHAEPPVTAPPVETQQQVSKSRHRRKHRRRWRSKKEDAVPGVPEQETGEIPPELHPLHAVLTEQEVFSEFSSSSSESGWVQETGGWETPSSNLYCHPFGHQSLDVAGPGAPDSASELAVKAFRAVVTYEDKRDGREYITPFVEAVVRDFREKEDQPQDDDINEGLLLHESLKPVDSEYLDGRDYSSSLIKSGSYGDVCRIRDNNTGFECAAKKVPLDRFKSMEVGAWSCLLPLPCVVELFGAVREGPNIILFMELKSGSLGQLLEQRGRLPEDLALYYFSQVLGALEHLHQRQILHLDVKADNVLLSEDGKNTFLCDFGHSEKLNTHGQCVRVNTDMKGTETHMAPEVVKAERCGTKADVWSCSCMLLHMRTGCHPWTRLYSRPLYLTIANEPPPLREIPPDCSPLVSDILKAGLQKEPMRRASPSELRVQATQALEAVGGLNSPVKGPYVKPLKKLDRHIPAATDATKPAPTATATPTASPTPHPTPPASSASLSPVLGRKRTTSRWKTCTQLEEQEGETQDEEGEHSPLSPAPLHTVNVTSATTASEQEPCKLERGERVIRDFFLSSLSLPHTAEIQEQLLSCLSSEGPSHLDLWDKKDSGRWSLSPGEDLSSGVFSSNSQSESQRFSMDWLGTPHLQPPLCLGGVDVCIQDFDGRCIRIREKPKVSVGHIARGISEQISEPVFSLQSKDGRPVSHNEEVQESGLLLRCVPAPDCNHSGHTPSSCRLSWRWRIKDGCLEAKN